MDPSGNISKHINMSKGKEVSVCVKLKTTYYTDTLLKRHGFKNTDTCQKTKETIGNQRTIDNIRIT